MGKKHTNVSTRVLVVTAKGIFGKSTAEITELTGLPKSTINEIYLRAVKAGFDPTSRPIVLEDAFFVDKPRSGRPKKQSGTWLSMHADQFKTLTTKQVSQQRKPQNPRVQIWRLPYHLRRRASVSA
jgi:transposase